MLIYIINYCYLSWFKFFLAIFIFSDSDQKCEGVRYFIMVVVRVHFTIELNERVGSFKYITVLSDYVFAVFFKCESLDFVVSDTKFIIC